MGVGRQTVSSADMRSQPDRYPPGGQGWMLHGAWKPGRVRFGVGAVGCVLSGVGLRVEGLALTV